MGVSLCSYLSRSHCVQRFVESTVILPIHRLKYQNRVIKICPPSNPKITQRGKNKALVHFLAVLTNIRKKEKMNIHLIIRNKWILFEKQNGPSY